MEQAELDRYLEDEEARREAEEWGGWVEPRPEPISWKSFTRRNRNWLRSDPESPSLRLTSEHSEC